MMVDSETTRRDIEIARTFLFVPGTRPEWFAKASAAGADVIIIDLEDAVAPADKAAARANAVAWMAAGKSAAVRVNVAHDAVVRGRHRGHPHGRSELRAQGRKRWRSGVTCRPHLVPLLDTVGGVLNAEEIRRGSRGVQHRFRRKRGSIRQTRDSLIHTARTSESVRRYESSVQGSV